MPDIALSASLEDYLEAIYIIALKKQAARAKDIADHLKVHRSSVTNALRALKERALINYTPYDIVTLTEQGKRVGGEIARRHEILREFFEKVLAVEPHLADKAACEMEHAIPKEVFQRFIEFVDYMETCPRGGVKWTRGAGYHCIAGGNLDDCERCVSASPEDIREKKRLQKKGANIPETTLAAVQVGKRMQITHIRGRGDVIQRLYAMGLTPGAVVEVERIAPLGDPVDIKVRGYHLSLRKEDLAKIEVEALPDREKGICRGDF